METWQYISILFSVPYYQYRVKAAKISILVLELHI